MKGRRKMRLAEKVAMMIHDLILEERRGCAEVAASGGYQEAAAAFLDQPSPIPSFRNMHCMCCSEGVTCTGCGQPTMIGRCPGLEP
jgi:hypothetical protein